MNLMYQGHPGVLTVTHGVSLVSLNDFRFFGIGTEQRDDPATGMDLQLKCRILVCWVELVGMVWRENSVGEYEL